MSTPIDEREFVHRIDGRGALSYVNAAWLAFANENNYRIDEADVLGRPLSESISNPETRHIYGLLTDRVRSSGRTLGFRYRCDSPEFRRCLRMRMRFIPAQNEIEFSSRVIKLEQRAPVRLLDERRARRTRKTLSMCSWCKAVLADEAWVEVEEALLRLG